MWRVEASRVEGRVVGVEASVDIAQRKVRGCGRGGVSRVAVLLGVSVSGVVRAIVVDHDHPQGRDWAAQARFYFGFRFGTRRGEGRKRIIKQINVGGSEIKWQ